LLRAFLFALSPKVQLRTLQLQTFKTRREAMEYIKRMQASLRICPEKGLVPNDPNSDEKGNVWVISVTPQENADPVYLFTNDELRY
jgi:hypothetical protein